MLTVDRRHGGCDIHGQYSNTEVRSLTQKLISFITYSTVKFLPTVPIYASAFEVISHPAG